MELQAGYIVHTDICACKNLKNSEDQAGNVHALY